jgi:hypothetical protein
VEVVSEAQRDGSLSSVIPAKDLGRLILAIMQGEEFLRKSGMSGADLKGIGAAAELLSFVGASTTTAQSKTVKRRKLSRRGTS